MARYPGLLLRVLANRHPAMGPGKAQLVTLIADTGSISATARKMGMSYRRAWQLVEAVNRSFNRPVVLTATGGKRGGGAVVTDFGRRLVERYRAMEMKASEAIAPDLAEFTKDMRRSAPRRKTR